MSHASKSSHETTKTFAWASSRTALALLGLALVALGGAYSAMFTYLAVLLLVDFPRIGLSMLSSGVGSETACELIYDVIISVGTGLFMLYILAKLLLGISRHVRNILELYIERGRADRLAAGCLALFHRDMRVLLAPIEEAIEETRKIYGAVKLEMVVGILRQRAQVLKCEGSSEGEVIGGIAAYLGSLHYTSAENKFDRAVAGGACPLTLIERILGW
jgi:hypothetical protein